MKFHMRLGTCNENIGWKSYISKVGKRYCLVTAALQVQLSTGSYNTGLVLWHQIFSGGGFPRFATEKLFTFGNYFLMLTGVCHFTKWLYPLRSPFIVINKYIFALMYFFYGTEFYKQFFCDKGTKVNQGFAFRVWTEADLSLGSFWWTLKAAC